MKRTGAIALVLSLCLVSPAFAANWYVRPSGGSGSGTSWTAAWNGFGGINWGSVSAGDTIWIAGGSYGDLTPGKGGSTNSRININRARSDSTACTGAAGWSSGYDSKVVQTNGTITINSHNNITISGRTTATGGTHGWHIDKSSYAGDRGIYFPNGSTASNITFEYIEVQGANTYTWKGEGNGIEDRPFTNSSNHTYSHLKVHGWNTPFYILGTNYHLAEYCEVYNTKGSSERHPNIYYIKHSEHGIIRFSKFHDNAASGTGICFSDAIYPVSSYDYWKVYGNVFWDNDANSGYALAIQDGPVNSIMLGMEIYNNTFDNSPTRFSGMSCGSGSVEKNNVFIGNSGTLGCGTVSNNVYVSAGDFINRTGRDYRPSSSSAMRNSGAVLSTDGYINKDMDGNTRGADGKWDVGAFEYAGDAIPSDSVIQAPTGIKIF